MRTAMASAILAVALAGTAAAQSVDLVEKQGAWSLYADTATPKAVCFIAAQPQAVEPLGANRGPIFFYISRWPADNVANEISVKMGYPFKEGAKVTATISGAKFELFTKEEGAFVEKPEMETKLIEAMKTGSTMKLEGTSVRGTKTTDNYSLSGLSDALDRAAKECGG